VNRVGARGSDGRGPVNGAGTRGRGARGASGPTVREVAAESGVSIATVSRVLNDSPNVSDPTRELVLDAVRRLGAPGQAARGTASPAGRRPRPLSGAVFVRCPYLLTDYFGLIVSSVAETLQWHGRAMLLDAGEASYRARVLADLPDRDGVAGAILLLPPEGSGELLALRRRGLPFVVVDPRTPLPRDVAAVSAANVSGARQATTHLLELGHRRIGVLAGPVGWAATDGRDAGHAAALADLGLLQDPALVRHLEPTVQDGLRAARELLDRPDRPTAIVAFNDKIAVGVLQAAGALGLRVPRDLSVTGFDDIDLAGATDPMLTTVRQPLTEMGRMAVSLLIRLLDGHDVDAMTVELATELVVRDSTAPPSRG